ncbi:hypothetical protein [Halomicrobium urmianum]|uniref:hypothetical protein n=1 Tax=Halomicrobium urmianum TaxID=1586233 RepID=UPI001CDA2D41|nr:hypothetical protein [Halomicrobium urmianum]
MIDDTDGLSRRSLLTVCSASLASIAGCSALPFGSDDDERSYEQGPLRTLAEQDLPEPPTGVTVTVPEGALDRHRRRARELLEEVPEEPAVPNGLIAARLARNRANVAEDLERGSTAEPFQLPLDRLGHWRYLRGEAAEVRGAYRAATSDVSEATVDERRGEIRTDLYDFLSEWEYRGEDPARALAVHYRIERLIDQCRNYLDLWPKFPERPADDVERVGRIAGDVETARAALEDAVAMRDRYVNGLDDPHSYRRAFTAVAREVHRTTDFTIHRKGLRQYLDAIGRPEWPHDRNLDGTVAETLYRRVQNLAHYRRHREARQQERYATTVVDGGISLAAVVALEDVVAAIRDGDHGQVESSSEVQTLAGEAQRALDGALTTEPQTVSLQVAMPAFDLLQDVTHHLAEHRVGEHEIHRAAGTYASARYFARSVPPVVRYLDESLSEASR